MARTIACVECGTGKPLPPHCKSPACPWVHCEEHGDLPLDGDDRA